MNPIFNGSLTTSKVEGKTKQKQMFFVKHKKLQRLYSLGIENKNRNKTTGKRRCDSLAAGTYVGRRL
jgi:hypothetical protein